MNRKDATLKEVGRLIQSVYPPARKDEAKLSFKVVYRKPSTGEYGMRPVGQLSQEELKATSPTTTKEKTVEEGEKGDESLNQASGTSSTDKDAGEAAGQLGNVKFYIGDFLDIAVFFPRPHTLGN